MLGLKKKAGGRGGGAVPRAGGVGGGGAPLFANVLAPFLVSLPVLEQGPEWPLSGMWRMARLALAANFCCIDVYSDRYLVSAWLKVKIWLVLVGRCALAQIRHELVTISKEPLLVPVL